MRWRAVLLGVVAVLATACGGDDEASPTATLGTAAPTTATTDPKVIPAVIDEAYVDRVLGGLDQAVGEINRLVVASKTIPPEAVERLKALYKGDFLQLRLDLLQQDMRKGFANYRQPPGNSKTTVSELLRGDGSCVFARVERDYSAVATTANPQPSTLWVVLKPIDSNSTAEPFNPTAWYYAYDGFEPGRVPPPDPCAD